MKHSRTVLALAPFLLLLAACEEPVTTTQAAQDDPTVPLAAHEAGVAITIIGAGTVTYDSTTVPPCSSPAGTVSCPTVRFQGNGAVTAKAATGWRFTGWSLTFGASSPNTITNPALATQEIVPGTSVALDATFVPLIKPISARFVQPAFMTVYRLDVDNPDLDVVKVQWSGPTCGEWTPKGELFSAESTNCFEMRWTHPHSPGGCDATTDHKTETIRATVTIKDKTFVCEYVGADDGTGTPCKPQ
jgi:hypothetical protein